MIYNPGPQAAELRLAVDLAQGVAEPFVLGRPVPGERRGIQPGGAVPARGRALRRPGEHQRRPGRGRADGRGQLPSALSGLGELPGGELAADRWLLPYFPRDTVHTGRVVVFNPSATPAQVSVGDVDGSPQLGTMTVAAGRWGALPLNNLRLIAGRPLLLTASQPVYVESDYYGKSPTTGISLSFGVPLNP